MTGSDHILPPRRSGLGVALIAATVFLAWLLALGIDPAVAILAEHWPIAVTMSFGALVAGGTGEGGGAIAFPILTKVLDVPAPEARVFSLAIQSIGMTSAGLALLIRRVPVSWPMIAWGSLGGAMGVVLGAAVYAPLLAPTDIRLTFTTLQAALGVVLLGRLQPEQHDEWGKGRPAHAALLIAAGVVGGVLSGLLGTGISVAAFSVLVVRLGVSERIAIPTAVMMVGPNSLIGFATYAALGGFTPLVHSYWLAAVPVAALAAPLGAVLCTKLTRRALVSILLLLIAAEAITTVLIIPMDTPTVITQAALLALFLAAYRAMRR